jgi:hypothetical protein
MKEVIICLGMSGPSNASRLTSSNRPVRVIATFNKGLRLMLALSRLR